MPVIHAENARLNAMATIHARLARDANTSKSARMICADMHDADRHLIELSPPPARPRQTHPNRRETKPMKINLDPEKVMEAMYIRATTQLSPSCACELPMPPIPWRMNSGRCWGSKIHSTATPSWILKPPRRGGNHYWGFCLSEQRS